MGHEGRQAAVRCTLYERRLCAGTGHRADRDNLTLKNPIRSPNVEKSQQIYSLTVFQTSADKKVGDCAAPATTLRPTEQAFRTF